MLLAESVKLMAGAVSPIIHLVMHIGVRSGAGARKISRLFPLRWIGTFGWGRHLSGLIIRRTIRVSGAAGGILAAE